MISGEEFNKIDLRAGTIVKSEPFEDVRKPAINCGSILAQIGGSKNPALRSPQHYHFASDLIGKQVICVTNFSPKQISNFISEVLVTGFPDEKGHVVLAAVDKQVPNGAKLF